MTAIRPSGKATSRLLRARPWKSGPSRAAYADLQTLQGSSPRGRFHPGSMQVKRTPKTYDVCIIGSGASGGTAAKVLTEGGLSVALLEAGPPLVPERDYKEHVWPYDLPHRGAGVGGRARQGLEDEFLAPNGAWEIEGEPYVSAPGSKFRWFRSRIVGGRTNHWGRIALRMAPVDFKVRSHDGMGDDWPISYDDVAPYYDKVESYIGVFGTKENIPSAPDGIFLPPPKPRCTETIIKKACDHLNIILHSVAPRDPDSAAQRPRRLSLLRAVRPRMHHRLELQFQPGDDSARRENRTLHLITGAMARELVVGKDGKVEAVSYIDKATHEERAHSRARVHRRRQRLRIRAAAAEFQVHAFPRRPGEFFRRRRPQSDGHRRQRWRRILSALESMPAHNHDGVGGMHMYLPWWKFDRKNDFLRGYHTEFGGGRGMPGVGDYDDLCDEFEGYGASLKQECKKKYGTYIGFAGRGEMIPNENCYCEIDPSAVDQWGIPGAALPLEVERQRNQDGEGYAGDVPRNRGSRGRSLSVHRRARTVRIPMASPMAA